MPLYSFKCPRCGERLERYASIDGDPPALTCPECAFDERVVDMVRDYRADRPFIGAVPQATYSPSLGMEVSDQRQVDDAMKRITEESYNRTGYVPDLVAMHRSEIQPATESHADPTGQALENASRAAHDGAVKRGEVDA